MLQQETENIASSLLQDIGKSLKINNASHPRRLEPFIFNFKGYSLKFLIIYHLVYLKLIAGGGTYVSDIWYRLNEHCNKNSTKSKMKYIFIVRGNVAHATCKWSEAQQYMTICATQKLVQFFCTLGRPP